MNKRPLMQGGLPAKPNYIGPAAPAPPLPSGPPPQQAQQAGYPQDQAAAAHAAAWAAYYQSQGYTAPAQAGYPAAPAAQPAPVTPNASAAAATTPNPYANYGYGAAAQQQHNFQGPAGPSQPHRPPAQQYQQQQYPQQAYTAPAQPQQGYQSPAAYQAPQAQYNQQPQYAWGQQPQPQHPQQQQQPAQPMQQRPPQQQYNQPNYYPQQQQYPAQPQSAPYRPPTGPSPSPMANRPYQPQQNRLPSGPVRPPIHAPQNNFPPAKRPRFDGPGPGIMQPRPPMRPAYNASIPVRPPSGPSARLPAPPIARPPIHLGTGGPPPMFAPGGPRGHLPMRGGPARGRGGMINAPRGPAGMRHRDKDSYRSKRGDTPGRERRRDREVKTTMTDFRIVGIEIKELDWTWGLTGEEANNVEKDEQEEAVEKKEAEDAVDHEVEEKAEEGAKEKAEETSEDQVLDQTKPAEEDVSVKVEVGVKTEEAEEKVGGKRKAQSPDGDDEGSTKKRTSNYLLTHGKPNESQGPPHESNQNRFRIYFESPPELDRIPKALRRNPNKRWRRESTVASRVGEDEEKTEVLKLDEVKEAEETAVGEQEAVGEAEAPIPVSETETGPELEASTVAVPSDAEVRVEDTPALNVSNAEAGAVADLSEEAAVEASTEAVDPVSAVDTEGETHLVAGEVDAAAATDSEAIAAGEPTAQSDADVPDSTPAPPSSVPSKPRTRRRTSVSSISSHDSAQSFAGEENYKPEVVPSTNRLSILYEGSSRRLCFDAEVVEKVKIFREEGKIEVSFSTSALAVEKDVETDSKAKEVKEEPEDESKVEGEDAKPVINGETEVKQIGLPKGFLLETYDNADQRFAPVTIHRLEELYSGEATDSIPPLHKALAPASVTSLTLTVYLNKKRPLSEPKWCRTDSANEWLAEQFGSKSQHGWRGKLEIVDPDPAPTLQTILETWASLTTAGSTSSRSEFTKSLLSDPNDLLEILLRLTRGDRNPTYTSASSNTQSANASGSPLATAIRSDSPYASHQTHVSLAILAMYRLTTDYAAKAGEKSEVVNEKVADIIKSLPSGMIHRSLDGMFREWDSEDRKREEKN